MRTRRIVLFALLALSLGSHCPGHPPVFSPGSIKQPPCNGARWLHRQLALLRDELADETLRLRGCGDGLGADGSRYEVNIHGVGLSVASGGGGGGGGGDDGRTATTTADRSSSTTDNVNDTSFSGKGRRVGTPKACSVCGSDRVTRGREGPDRSWQEFFCRRCGNEVDAVVRAQKLCGFAPPHCSQPAACLGVRLRRRCVFVRGRLTAPTAAQAGRGRRGQTGASAAAVPALRVLHALRVIRQPRARVSPAHHPRRRAARAAPGRLAAPSLPFPIRVPLPYPSTRTVLSLHPAAGEAVQRERA
jgi:hypothetical protein